MSADMNSRILKETMDGSHTLYQPDLDEHYHSTKGALQESLHVFIKNGYDFFNINTELHILEVGFGTGLNALLTLAENRKLSRKVWYTGIEKHPLPKATIEKLNYVTYLHEVSVGELFQMHDAVWGHWQSFHGEFYLKKIEVDLLDFQTTEGFDLIYFDAFAPDKQPELWSEEVFNLCYQILKTAGVLVTYSAKGLIKRRLKHVGFEVETLTGPPGKREMIRALK
jgi:tRNA U34 5-methylaminomethyl-2-thiouridine-forming methyltransferase MnmC